jgi:hypothetical protein
MKPSLQDFMDRYGITPCEKMERIIPSDLYVTKMIREVKNFCKECKVRYEEVIIKTKKDSDALVLVAYHRRSTKELWQEVGKAWKDML